MAAGSKGVSTLYLLRHAKAGGPNPKGDRARGLAEAGRRGAAAIAAAIAERHIRPALVLCSDSVRTRETLAIILAKFGPAPEVLYEEELYIADAKKLLRRLRRVPEETESLMVVGHNPGLQELAVLLSDQPTGPLIARVVQEFPTSALARFEVSLPWSMLEPGGAHLTALIAPK
jgi:phosphohistidine phosphatase